MVSAKYLVADSPALGISSDSHLCCRTTCACRLRRHKRTWDGGNTRSGLLCRTSFRIRQLIIDSFSAALQKKYPLVIVAPPEFPAVIGSFFLGAREADWTVSKKIMNRNKKISGSKEFLIKRLQKLTKP